MKPLISYLNNNEYLNKFSNQELNEILIWTYDFILSALNDGANRIYVYPNEIEWKKDTDVIDHFVFQRAPTPGMNFLDMFIAILNKDLMIQKHLKIIERDESMIAVQIML